MKVLTDDGGIRIGMGYGNGVGNGGGNRRNGYEGVENEVMGMNVVALKPYNKSLSTVLLPPEE